MFLFKPICWLLDLHKWKFQSRDYCSFSMAEGIHDTYKCARCGKTKII
jgi:hypothetical protein